MSSTARGKPPMIMLDAPSVVGRQAKHCPDCDRWFPPSGFYRNRCREDGLASICKACSRERLRIWQQKNRPRINKMAATWRAKRRSEINARARLRGQRPEFKAHKKQYSKVYYQNNKDKWKIDGKWKT